MMRQAIAALACVMALGAGWAGAQSEAKLPVRRVILYKHGVGYFERRGTVQGDALIPLHFKSKEMSDLLKSLTVLDLGGGTVSTIAYESTKTVDQQLGEYTFDLKGAATLPAILEQMKGSEVTLVLAGGEVRGRVLAIEKRSEKRGEATAETWRLSVLTATGAARSYDLGEIAEIRFTDPRLQSELQAYLKTLFSRHRRDQKEVVISTTGKGARDLFVAYVQEQPVWKVSYRVVLADKQKPLLQAWAIVDNVSEEDWENVSLSLVSGLPVSFVQNLYDPWYIKRPEIRVQRETAVGPVLYQAGETQATAVADAEGAAMGRMRAKGGVAERKEMARSGAMLEMAAPMAAPSPDLMANMAQQTAVAVAQAAGALFRYDIREAVTLKRDRSALLPIASAAVEAKAVSIYDESVRQENPMEAVHLKNTTGLTLEGGPVTVFQANTYAGEALLDTLKDGEDRFISFAVDLGTRVNTRHGGVSQTIQRVRIVRGVLYTEYKQQETKVYALTNVEPREKTIVIQHPFRPGWELVNTQKPAETTPQHYRFEVKLPARKGDEPAKVEFKVTEELPGQSQVALTNLNRDQIVYYVRQKYIDDATRRALEKVVDLQAQISQLRQQMQEQERQRQEIGNSQARIRQNLTSLGQTDQERSLRARYVKQWEAEEDRMLELNRRVDELKRSIDEKQKELDALLTNIAFEQKVER